MLKVEGLTKRYPAFSLTDVSFSLPAGYIMGFIGMNGAGKSTTLKAMLNLVRPDSGRVEIFGKDFYANELEIKQDIGFMLGPIDYYTRTRVKGLIDVYKRFYTNWDDNVFQGYLTKFNLDINKKITELSAGMKVKLGIAMALSHDAKLIIFDEPTSGLDPVARDELLDIFQGIVEAGDRSILFSTHITSDLDKCADYIIFIRNGRLVANDTKDDLLDKHVVIKGAAADLTESLKARVISCKQNSFGFSALIRKERLEKTDKVTEERANLEDLMVYYNKEERQ